MQRITKNIGTNIRCLLVGIYISLCVLASRAFDISASSRKRSCKRDIASMGVDRPPCRLQDSRSTGEMSQ